LAALLCGCAGWKVKDEGYVNDDMSETVRRARSSQHRVEVSSPSEKGRQIERDLNAL
jgi:hypothetical protein